MSDFTVRCEGEGRDEVVVLAGGPFGAEAKVAVAIGANLMSWGVAHSQRGPIQAIDNPVDLGQLSYLPTYFGSPVLVPFPNRMKDGHFTFGGESHQLPVDERRRNPSHGVVKNQPWQVQATSADAHSASVTLGVKIGPDQERTQWPYAMDVRITYTLRATEVAITLELTSRDERPQPWGAGFHPYFRLPLVPGTSREEHTFTIPCLAHWELDKESIPTGEIRDVRGTERDWTTPAALIADVKLDTVFTRTEHDSRGRSAGRLEHPASGIALEVEGDHSVREWVIYIPADPKRHTIAIEPYTCATDAFNLASRGIDGGMRVLAPGETAKLDIVYRLTGLTS